MSLDENDQLLDKVVKEKVFYHVCQPLYDLNSWQVFGYEILIRSELFENPEQLFRCAKDKNRLFELDTFSIFNAVLMNDDLSRMRHMKWFLNVYPSTLVHPSFHDILNRLGDSSLPSRNLIFELNETDAVTDMDLLKRAVTCLKAKYAVALDDVGKGKSTLRAIIELEPDYIKLDKFFSIDLAVSRTKQNMIRMLVDFCQESNIRLVLEGIERSKDLAVAKALGVHLGQGFLLGKPVPVSKMMYKEG